MPSGISRKFFGARGQMALLLASTTVRMCLGCTRNPQVECTQDQAQLLTVLTDDKRVDEVLRQVDHEATSGKGTKAADLIASSVKPASARAEQTVQQLKPSTIWGTRMKGELSTLMQRRREAISGYEKALRTDDLRQVVEQMKLQADLEKSALALEQRLKAAPTVGSGECAAVR